MSAFETFGMNPITRGPVQQSPKTAQRKTIVPATPAATAKWRDPDWVYVRSESTNLRVAFERIRAMQLAGKK